MNNVILSRGTRFALLVSLSLAMPLSLAQPALAEPPRPPIDRVLIHPRAKLERQSSATTSTYYDQQGDPIRFQFSPQANASVAQSYANFLGSLYHGSEIRLITVFLATPQEIVQPELCGAGTLACYDPFSDEIFVPDSGLQENLVKVTVAHEYGHHVANHRSNYPWSAGDWGAKRWATYEHVCQGVRAGRYFPGNEGSHYFDNPNEAWAESYAWANGYTDPPFAYNHSLAPDQDAYAAIRRDALHPWTGGRSMVTSGGLGRRRSTSRLISTPLDGRMVANLHGPNGADFDLYLRAASGRMLARSASGGSSESIAYTVCGQRQLRVEVDRYRGSGEFSLQVIRP